MFTIGLLEKIFPKWRQNANVNAYFKTLTAYTPVYTTYEGGVYEMELTRAAIHSFATHCSKLKPELMGTAHKSLEKTLAYKPNPYMDTSKFLYRLATILSVQNTAFIVPLTDEFGLITGYFPLLPSRCDVLDADGEPWLRYTFATGQTATMEMSKVGVLTQFQYKSDFFGESNEALNPTLQLIHAQNQGIINGVKNSAAIRFLAKIGNLLKPEDIKNERNRFAEDNLSADNQSGLIVYDNKFSDLKQIDSKPFFINPQQMKNINENVFNYFGTNEDILQNKFNEEKWDAYYEGKLEPFAIQLALVMSNMTYTQREIAHGNGILWTANRLQYASNKTKLEISTQLFDRGRINGNMIADIWNWKHPPNGEGEKFYIRREYIEVSRLGKEEQNNASKTGSGISGDGAATGDSDRGKTPEQ